MSEQENIKLETLILALSKMFDKNIIRADYQIKELKGYGVKLVSGNAETVVGEKLPYKVVQKIQKGVRQYDDPGDDPGLWRREYDLCVSDFNSIFSDSDSFRWAKCYHAEMNDDEWQVWMEYIDGVSGDDLTVEMLEQAATELGRFQSRLYKEKPRELQNISCFSQIEHAKHYYSIYSVHTRKYSYMNYIRGEDCELPEHLRQMFIDVDNDIEATYSNNKMPVVLCHRDFGVINIIYSDGGIRVIDWDGSGWGYIGEDIVKLIVHKVSKKYINVHKQDFEEYYHRLVSAYLKGFAEYANISAFDSSYIWKIFVIKVGYGIMIDRYMDAQSNARKTLIVDMLQRIYEMKDIKFDYSK